MNIAIHAEVEGADEVQVYEGEDLQAAKDFMSKLTGVKDIQCNMTAKVNGESTALARRGKGADAESLISDINAWLAERSPDYAGNDPALPPGEERETVTIAPSDVAEISAEDLLK